MADEPTSPKPAPGDPGAAGRAGMAAERTWLAWWRTALGATAGALGVGGSRRTRSTSPAAPYVILGCGYALLALALLMVGALRQRDLARAVQRGEQAPLPFVLVAAFTIGGAALAVMTVVLVLFQT